MASSIFIELLLPETPKPIIDAADESEDDIDDIELLDSTGTSTDFDVYVFGIFKEINTETIAKIVVSIKIRLFLLYKILKNSSS